MRILDIEMEAKQNYMDTISWLFSELNREFLESTICFSELIRKHYNKIYRSIPNKLKKSLSEFYGIDNYFGGGYYPKRLGVVKIFNDLKPLLETFLKEDIIYMEPSELKLWASGILFNILSIDYGYNDLNHSYLLNELDDDIRGIIINNFLDFVGTVSKDNLRDTVIKQLRKKEFSLPETQVWGGYFENLKSNFTFFVKSSFEELAPIDKILLIFIVWFYVPRIKGGEYEYTNEKLSFSDREMLLDIMADKYLEIHEKYDADFLHFFKSSEL